MRDHSSSHLTDISFGFPSLIRLPGPELPISTERYELLIIAPIGPLRERKLLLEDRPLRIQES